MNDAALEPAGWRPQTIAGIPALALPRPANGVGAVVMLPDLDWPDRNASGPEDLAAIAEQLQAAHCGAVLPLARCWWIDRPDPQTAEFPTPLAFITGAVIPWMAERASPGLRLAAFGVGLGGQGAMQLAYRFPQQFPVVAAVSPAVDFHRLHASSPQLQAWFETEERARQETATLRLHPLNWPPHQWFSCPRTDWRFDGCERLASKLGSSGIPYAADLDPAGGLPEQIARALEFITARLNQPPATREIRFGR